MAEEPREERGFDRRWLLLLLLIPLGLGVWWLGGHGLSVAAPSPEATAVVADGLTVDNLRDVVEEVLAGQPKPSTKNEITDIVEVAVETAVDEAMAEYELPAEPSAEPSPSQPAVPPSPTATPKPVAPAASAPSSSMKYDEMGCTSDLVACVPGEQAAWWQADSANRHLFPAIYLRNVQSGDRLPSDAIVQIQQMASGWAKSWDKWTAFNADPQWPTLVWCPQRNCEYVPDTAFPLLNAPGVSSEWYYSIAIVSAHLPADPSASQTQVVCPSGDCWAVLLH